HRQQQSGIAAVAPSEHIYAVQPKLVQKGLHVLRKQFIGIAPTVFGRFTLPAGIHSDDPVMFLKIRYLESKSCDGLRVPMQQQKRLTLTVLLIVKFDAIGLHKLSRLVVTAVRRCRPEARPVYDRGLGTIVGCGSGCCQRKTRVLLHISPVLAQCIAFKAAHRNGYLTKLAIAGFDEKLEIIKIKSPLPAVQPPECQEFSP